MDHPLGTGDDRRRKKRLGYVPALDGLRGVAIALVVAFHYTGFPFGGGSGVDLFFVLSGFLITTLLIEEMSEAGRISLSGFYARRARRLLPALIVMLAAFSVISLAKGHDPLGDLGRFGFYTGNITKAFIAPHAPDTGLNHLWSLAEEEQFYLVWPLLVFLFLRTRQHFIFVTVLAGALVLYRAGLALHGASPARLSFAPDTHSDGLVIGAACAILLQRRALRVPEGWLPWIVIGFSAIVVFPPANIAHEIVVVPLCELLCVALIIAAVTASSLAVALSWQPLVFLGKISYSLYLWHFMIWWALGWHDPLLALAISLTAAWLSSKFVEQRFRRRRAAPVADAVEPAVATVPAS